MTNLSSTWVVVTIGNKRYAINNIYVRSIVELNTVLFREPVYKNTFIKGTYDIHGAVVNVLDGRKLVQEKTIDEKKMQFASMINNIRCKHEVWLDAVEWELLTKDSLNDSKVKDDSLYEFIYNSSFSDVHINRLVEKMKQPFEIVHKLADKELLNRRNGGELGETLATIAEMRRQSSNYIVKRLEQIIELNNKKLTEMCVIVSAKGVTFGISIDAVDMITDSEGSKVELKGAKLSAGIIELRGTKYDVINLTKLGKILYINND